MRDDVVRVLLILLALLVSAPAAAMPACHDPAAVASAHATPMPHHRAPDPAPTHACLGCVPLGDWLAPRIAAPLPLPAPAPVARIVALDVARALPPPLRPPRLG